MDGKSLEHVGVTLALQLPSASEAFLFLEAMHRAITM
jgi:hypothetical protein